MTGFEEFFSRATGGLTPYPYQHALATGPWPELVDVPTGLGKTAGVTLAWLYRRRVLGEADMPRRLVWCLPMRVLVEQTRANVETWLDRLEARGEAGDLERVAVHSLMGGDPEVQRGSWTAHPEQEAVLIGTQDMLLSRALMRGYGMSRFGWPIHFGLLHTDALWVFDEVQLMGPGIATGAQLEGLRRRLGGTNGSRSLWLSATLNRDWLATVDFRDYLSSARTHRLSEKDRTEAVSARLKARKHVAQAETRLTPASLNNGAKDYAEAVAREVAAAHPAGKTTIVVLNTVGRAQAVYRALAEAAPSVQRLLIHSRFRAPDRRARTTELEEAPGKAGRIVIATQALEAGVDTTSAVSFTELAPWSSLVQRFGRCNRYGEEPEASIRWIDIELDTGTAPPYADDDLSHARRMLEALESASPADLPPVDSAAPYRHVLRRPDLLALFNTDPDLSGFDVDVSPYIRDTDDTDIQVFWRELSGNMAEQCVPGSDELCRAPVAQIAAYLKKLVRNNERTAHQWDALAGRWVRLQGATRPGMILMLDAALGGYTPDAGFDADAKDRVPVLDSPAAGLPDDTGGDSGSRQGPQFLSRHLADVEDVARALCEAIGEDAGRECVLRAARWHDVGKAHPIFQATLTACLDEAPAEPLAKSPCGGRHSRRYFRHELASALAWLAQHDGEERADLVAYLVAAHHGKVRLGLGALPDEHEPDTPGTAYARGIWDGDELPAVSLCGREQSNAVRLSLERMMLGAGRDGPSWSTRTAGLLDALGPFRLAWLEALVRVADQRASRNEEVGP